MKKVLWSLRPTGLYTAHGHSTSAFCFEFLDGRSMTDAVLTRSRLTNHVEAGPSPTGRRWPEGPDEGRKCSQTLSVLPSPGASRHPLPMGEGPARKWFHLCESAGLVDGHNDKRQVVVLFGRADPFAHPFG